MSLTVSVYICNILALPLQLIRDILLTYITVLTPRLLNCSFRRISVVCVQKEASLIASFTLIVAL